MTGRKTELSLDSPQIFLMEIICKKCSKPLEGRQKMYCSRKCKQRVLITDKRQAYKKENGIALQSQKGLRIKASVIKTMGGGCKICGYSKNITALEFHHLDPSQKLFVLDSRSFSNRSIKAIEEELKKCILVCSNCHQEIHYPLMTLEKYS